jgi:hypothetical protein
MTSIDPADLEEYRLLERRFWNTLQQTFSRVLNTSTGVVDDYRASLAEASSYERLLALHDDPLDVAADLSGITLTPEMVSRYGELLSEIYLRETISPSLIRTLTPLPLTIPTLPELHRSLLTNVVPMATLVEAMARLGYHRIEEYEGGGLLWESRSRAVHYASRLPEAITTPPPIYTLDGNLAYDVQSILDLYNRIIALARHRGASSEELRSVTHERDEFARALR